jgi:hypothetical protein
MERKRVDQQKNTIPKIIQRYWSEITIVAAIVLIALIRLRLLREKRFSS